MTIFLTKPLPVLLQVNFSKKLLVVCGNRDNMAVMEMLVNFLLLISYIHPFPSNFIAENQWKLFTCIIYDWDVSSLEHNTHTKINIDLDQFIHQQSSDICQKSTSMIKPGLKTISTQYQWWACNVLSSYWEESLT